MNPKRRETGAGCLWNSLISRIGNELEQLFDTAAPDRRNNPKLGKMGPDRVDERGLLTNKQMARAVEHQAALLLGRLGWHEPHVGPGNRLTDGLGVSRIVLLPFDVWLHVGRRHQPNDMTNCL